MPYFGAVPDQNEGAIMFPIEENNCQIKSTNNPAEMGSIDASASINESSESLSTVNSNNLTSLVESEAQTSVEKQNVSNIYIYIFINYQKTTNEKLVT